MKKRLLAWLLTGVMAVSVLAGCGNSGNEGAASEVTEESSEAASAEEESGEATAEPEAAPTTDGEKTVITFWNGFTGSDKETLEALVQEYNETNDKNIQVEMNLIPETGYGFAGRGRAGHPCDGNGKNRNLCGARSFCTGR